MSWIISLGPESFPQAPQLDGQGGLGRCHPLPRWEVDEMGPSGSHQASSSHLELLFLPRAHRDAFNLGRTHFSFRFSFSRLLPGHQLPSVASWTADISNMSWGSEGLHYRLREAWKVLKPTNNRFRNLMCSEGCCGGESRDERDRRARCHLKQGRQNKSWAGP